jgi:hypothetical protein
MLLIIVRMEAPRGTFLAGQPRLASSSFLQARLFVQGMIRKNGNRFSEKIMLKQRDEIMMRFHLIAS